MDFQVYYFDYFWDFDTKKFIIQYNVNISISLMRKIILFFFINLLFIAFVYPQDKQLVQLTGRITDEIFQPLPFAHILIMNNFRGTISDSDGKFSIVTEVNDTILFSTVGYKRKIIVIPDTLPKPFLIIDLRLKQDTILIAEVEIYPWKSYEEFKEAFLNLKLPDDDNERARRNIALIKTQIILDNSPNARENFNHVMEQQYRETFNKWMSPTYQVLNPFAWAKFFEALKRGDFKRD